MAKQYTDPMFYRTALDVGPVDTSEYKPPPEQPPQQTVDGIPVYVTGEGAKKKKAPKKTVYQMYREVVFKPEFEDETSVAYAAKGAKLATFLQENAHAVADGNDRFMAVQLAEDLVRRQPPGWKDYLDAYLTAMSPYLDATEARRLTAADFRAMDAATNQFVTVGQAFAQAPGRKEREQQLATDYHAAMADPRKYFNDPDMITVRRTREERLRGQPEREVDLHAEAAADPEYPAWAAKFGAVPDTRPASARWQSMLADVRGVNPDTVPVIARSGIDWAGLPHRELKVLPTESSIDDPKIAKSVRLMVNRIRMVAPDFAHRKAQELGIKWGTPEAETLRRSIEADMAKTFNVLPPELYDAEEEYVTSVIADEDRPSAFKQFQNSVYAAVASAKVGMLEGLNAFTAGMTWQPSAADREEETGVASPFTKAYEAINAYKNRELPPPITVGESIAQGGGEAAVTIAETLSAARVLRSAGLIGQAGNVEKGASLFIRAMKYLAHGADATLATMPSAIRHMREDYFQYKDQLGEKVAAELAGQNAAMDLALTTLSGGLGFNRLLVDTGAAAVFKKSLTQAMKGVGADVLIGGGTDLAGAVLPMWNTWRKTTENPTMSGFMSWITAPDQVRQLVAAGVISGGMNVAGGVTRLRDVDFTPRRPEPVLTPQQQGLRQSIDALTARIDDPKTPAAQVERMKARRARLQAEFNAPQVDTKAAAVSAQQAEIKQSIDKLTARIASGDMDPAVQERLVARRTRLQAEYDNLSPTVQRPTSAEDAQVRVQLAVEDAHRQRGKARELALSKASEIADTDVSRLSPTQAGERAAAWFTLRAEADAIRTRVEDDVRAAKDLPSEGRQAAMARISELTGVKVGKLSPEEAGEAARAHYLEQHPLLPAEKPLTLDVSGDADLSTQVRAAVQRARGLKGSSRREAMAAASKLAGIDVSKLEPVAAGEAAQAHYLKQHPPVPTTPEPRIPPTRVRPPAGEPPAAYVDAPVQPVLPTTPEPRIPPTRVRPPAGEPPAAYVDAPVQPAVPETVRATLSPQAQTLKEAVDSAAATAKQVADTGSVTDKQRLLTNLGMPKKRAAQVAKEPTEQFVQSVQREILKDDPKAAKELLDSGYNYAGLPFTGKDVVELAGRAAKRLTDMNVFIPIQRMIEVFSPALAAKGNRARNYTNTIKAKVMKTGALQRLAESTGNPRTALGHIVRQMSPTYRKKQAEARRMRMAAMAEYGPGIQIGDKTFGESALTAFIEGRLADNKHFKPVSDDMETVIQTLGKAAEETRTVNTHIRDGEKVEVLGPVMLRVEEGGKEKAVSFVSQVQRMLRAFTDNWWRFLEQPDDQAAKELLEYNHRKAGELKAAGIRNKDVERAAALTEGKLRSLIARWKDIQTEREAHMEIAREIPFLPEFYKDSDGTIHYLQEVDPLVRAQRLVELTSGRLGVLSEFGQGMTINAKGEVVDSTPLHLRLPPNELDPVLQGGTSQHAQQAMVERWLRSLHNVAPWVAASERMENPVVRATAEGINAINSAKLTGDRTAINNILESMFGLFATQGTTGAARYFRNLPGAIKSVLTDSPSEARLMAERLGGVMPELYHATAVSAGRTATAKAKKFSATVRALFAASQGVADDIALNATHQMIQELRAGAGMQRHGGTVSGKLRTLLGQEPPPEASFVYAQQLRSAGLTPEETVRALKGDIDPAMETTLYNSILRTMSGVLDKGVDASTAQSHPYFKFLFAFAGFSNTKLRQIANASRRMSDAVADAKAIADQFPNMSEKDRAKFVSRFHREARLNLVRHLGASVGAGVMNAYLSAILAEGLIDGTESAWRETLETLEDDPFDWLMGTFLGGMGGPLAQAYNDNDQSSPFLPVSLAKEIADIGQMFYTDPENLPRDNRFWGLPREQAYASMAGRLAPGLRTLFSVVGIAEPSTEQDIARRKYGAWARMHPEWTGTYRPSELPEPMSYWMRQYVKAAQKPDFDPVTAADLLRKAYAAGIAADGSANLRQSLKQRRVLADFMPSPRHTPEQAAEKARRLKSLYEYLGPENYQVLIGYDMMLDHLADLIDE